MSSANLVQVLRAAAIMFATPFAMAGFAYLVDSLCNFSKASDSDRRRNYLLLGQFAFFTTAAVFLSNSLIDESSSKLAFLA